MGYCLTPPQLESLDPTASVWVTASAGSGKTKVLIDRLVSLMLCGHLPQRLLCLTFTRVGAAEMSNRLYQTLSDWANMDDQSLDEVLKHFPRHAPHLTQDPSGNLKRQHARQLFSLVLETPGGLRIQTLHGFCQSLLRTFPFEAGIAPHFDLLEERDAQELLQKAQDKVIDLAAQCESGALSYLTAHLSERKLAPLIREAIMQPHKLKIFFQNYDHEHQISKFLSRTLGVGLDQTCDQLFRHFVAKERISLLAKIIPNLLKGTVKERYLGQTLQDWIEDPSFFSFTSYRSLFLTERGQARKFLISPTWAQKNPEIACILLEQGERFLAFEKERRRTVLFQNCQAFLHLLFSIFKTYAAYKHQDNLLDYSDLILKVVPLLKNKDNSAAWVLYKLDGGLDHILIDEAQDTSWDQWQVIDALVQEFFTTRSAPKTLFVVGDPKQSIYSFQGADVTVFERMRCVFRDCVLAHNGRWKDIFLDISFRSAPPILKSLDHYFLSPHLQPGVVEGSPLKHWPCPFKEKAFGCVEVWPLIPFQEKQNDSFDTPPSLCPSVEVLMSRAIARKIDALLGQPLYHENRPILPQDILILVRRRGTFLETLSHILKEKNIPVSGVDRLRFTTQMPILDLVALGEVLLLPTDDLLLAKVLKGPFFSFSEEQLFVLAIDRANLSLWDRLHQQYPEIAQSLEDLRHQLYCCTPFALYHRFLYQKGGLQRLLSRLGPEARDPVEEFMECAREYEKRHPPHLQGFLSWLERQDVEVQREVGLHGREEVRLMTVHRSKGLQAPIVFLPDTTQPPQGVFPLLWTPEFCPLVTPSTSDQTSWIKTLQAQHRQNQIEEYHRLFYVAMTRAQERVYISGWQKTKNLVSESWYAAVYEQMTSLPGVEHFSFYDPGWEGQGLRLQSGRASPVEKTAIADKPLFEQLPPWATQLPPHEEPLPTPIAPTRVTLPVSAQALRHGQTLHGFLNMLSALNEETYQTLKARFQGNPLFKKAERIVRHQEFKIFFGPQAQREVPLAGYVRNILYSGRIDCLLIQEHMIHIIDFKSDSNPSSGENMGSYGRQLALYRALLQPIYPSIPITCGILWLALEKLEWLSPYELEAAERCALEAT